MIRRALLAAVAVAGSACAHIGTAIAVDREGGIHFVDTTRNRHWRIDPGGRLTVVAPNCHTGDLFRDADGNVVYQEREQPPGVAVAGGDVFILERWVPRQAAARQDQDPCFMRDFQNAAILVACSVDIVGVVSNQIRDRASAGSAQ